MYSEESVIDKIEVLENGQIQVRRADRVLRDGVVIAEVYHRHVVGAESDLSGEHERVRVIADVVRAQLKK